MAVGERTALIGHFICLGSVITAAAVQLRAHRHRGWGEWLCHFITCYKYTITTTALIIHLVFLLPKNNYQIRRAFSSVRNVNIQTGSDQGKIPRFEMVNKQLFLQLLWLRHIQTLQIGILTVESKCCSFPTLSI